MIRNLCKNALRVFKRNKGKSLCALFLPSQTPGPALNNTANTAGVNRGAQIQNSLENLSSEIAVNIKPASLIYIKVGLLAIKKKVTTVGISRGGFYDCEESYDTTFGRKQRFSQNSNILNRLKSED